MLFIVTYKMNGEAEEGRKLYKVGKPYAKIRLHNLFVFQDGHCLRFAEP